MAEQQNPLKPLFKEIANAIREKEESTDAIIAEDFPERIQAIDTMPEGMYTVSVASSDPEGGSVSGGGIASEGMTVTVGAEAAYTHRFKCWQENGNIVDYDEQYTFPVEKDRNLTAIFELPPSRLPEGYTEVEYVQNLSTAGSTSKRIRTGIKVTATMRIVADCQLIAPYMTSATAFNQRLFGGSAGSVGSMSYFSVGVNKSGLYIQLVRSGSSADGSLTTVDSSVKDERIVVDLDRVSNTMSVNGVVKSTSIPTTTMTNTTRIYLPADTGFVAANGLMGCVRYYSFKAYSDGTLTNDLVPAKNSSGTAGFYDLITETFLEPSGTGSAWIAGPAV